MGVTFSPDSTARLSVRRRKRQHLDRRRRRRAGSSARSISTARRTRSIGRSSVVATPGSASRARSPATWRSAATGAILYVVDQAASRCTSSTVARSRPASMPRDAIIEPDNFAAVIGHVNVGRYPFGIALSPDDRTLLVTHVGVFQYTHLRPASPTGNDNVDYPLCYPGAGYPDETRNDRVIEITKVDPRNLPDSLRDPDGIRCGYVPADRLYTVPGTRQSRTRRSRRRSTSLDVSRPDEPAAARDRQDRAAGRRARRRDRRLQRQSSQRGRRRPGRDLRRQRQQRQHLGPRSRGAYAGARPHRRCRCSAARIAR